jgi:hypothetical protein
LCPAKSENIVVMQGLAFGRVRRQQWHGRKAICAESRETEAPNEKPALEGRAHHPAGAGENHLLGGDDIPRKSDADQAEKGHFF